MEQRDTTFVIPAPRSRGHCQLIGGIPDGGVEETMDRERDSQLVFGPDGTVLAATGSLPSGLVDVRLEDCESLSHEIRAAGTALLHELRGSGNRVAVAVVPGTPLVQLVAIEALAIRRTATDLRALLASKLNVIGSQAAAVDVSLNIAIAADVPATVRLDPEKVAWAVTTLVGNALRYMRVGTRRVPWRNHRRTRAVRSGQLRDRRRSAG